MSRTKVTDASPAKKGTPVAERSPASRTSSDGRGSDSLRSRTVAPSKRTTPPGTKGPGRSKDQPNQPNQNGVARARTRREPLAEPESRSARSDSEPVEEVDEAPTTDVEARSKAVAEVVDDEDVSSDVDDEDVSSDVDDEDVSSDVDDEVASGEISQATRTTTSDAAERCDANADYGMRVAPVEAGKKKRGRIRNRDASREKGEETADPDRSTSSDASEAPVARPVGDESPSAAAVRPRWLARHAVAVAVVLSGFFVAGAGIGGYLFAESRPDVWQAEAEIVLQSPASQVDRYLGTQMVMAASGSVLGRAAEAVPLTATEIDEDLGVETIDAGVALRISFDSEDPSLAVDVVEAVVTSYLTEIEAETTNTTRAVYSARIEELQRARAIIEADLAVVESSNAAAEALELPLPNPTEERRLSLESALLLEQISGLEGQLLVTDIELLNDDQAVVVTAARLLDERVGPSPLTAAALGVLAGGVIAVTVVFLLGWFRTKRRLGA